MLLAAERGHEAVAGEWAKVGYVENFSGRFTILPAAAIGGHEGIVRMLLEKGSDVNAKNSGGATALMLAKKNGHRAVVRLATAEFWEP
jgi:ankyrin repeat protein